MPASRPLRTCLLVLLLASGLVAAARPQDDPFARGQQAFRQQSWDAALEGYTAFLRRSPDDPRSQEAAFRSAFCLARLDRAEEARQALADWLPRAPATAWKARGFVLQGNLAEEQGEARAAEESYGRAVQAAGRGPIRLEALLARGRLLGTAASASLRRTEAEQDLVAVIRGDFRGPLGAEARLVLGDLYLQNPQVYDQTVDRAVDVWRELARVSPASPRVPEARLRSARAFSSDDRFPEAMEDLEALLRDHPTSPQAGEARRLVDEILAPRVQVKAERVFRPGEVPRVLLRTRNVPEVEVAAWPVELLEAFAGARSLEGLAAGFAPRGKPALRWLHSTPDLGDHRWSETELEVPLERSGAWVVTARVGEQRGAALLLVSRLALVVLEGAGGDSAAWVVDARDGRAAGTARVLQASRPDAEGRFTRLAPLAVEPGGLVSPGEGEVLLLARRQDDYALVEVRPAPAPGGDLRTFLYTDRPLYRPGDRVHWKAVVRTSGSGYQVPAERRFEARLRSPRGETVASATLESTAAGTMAGHADLPEAGPPGTWTLVLEALGADGTRRSAGSAGVRVQEFPEAGLQVQVRPGRPAWRSGERARVEVRAASPAGAAAGALATWTVTRRPLRPGLVPDASMGWFFSPAVAAPVEVASGRGRLDARGRMEAAFPLRGPGTYVVTARVQDRSRGPAEGSASLAAGDQPFFLAAWPERTLWSPGATVQVGVQARSLEGRPLALPVEVAVQPPSGPPRSQTLPLDASGRGRLSFPADQEGPWHLDLRAPVPGGPPVTASVRVQVGTGGGTDRLQVVPDRSLYRPGEVARVLIRTPEPGMHVLLSVEGRQVERRMVVSCPGTATVVDLPVAGDLSPNAWFRALAMRDFRRLQDVREVLVPAVDGVLGVEVKPAPEGVRPGKTGRVEVLTRDARGRPVAAEVSLSAHSPLPLRGPSIQSFFHGGRVEHAVRLLTSLGGPAPAAPPGPEAETRAEEPGVSSPPATAYWQANLRTGPDGRAEALVPWPDRPAAWSLTAVAVGPGTAVGEGSARVEVRKDLSVRLAAPSFLNERDAATLEAGVTTALDSATDLRLEWGAAGLRLEGAAPTSLGLGPRGQRGLAVPVAPRAVGPASLTLQAHAAAESASARADLRVLPHGLERRVDEGGAFQRSASARLVVPPRREGTRLQVNLAPGPMAAMADGAAALLESPPGSAEATVSRFAAPAAALRALRERGHPRPDLEARLGPAAREGLRRLAGQQHPDGGWGWWPEDPSDPSVTSYVVMGMAVAREAGAWAASEDRPESGLRRGVLFLRGRLPGLDPDEAALALWALARAGRAPERDLSEAFRRRGRLGDAGRFALALALQRQGRTEEARALLEESRRTALQDREAGVASWAGPGPASRSGLGRVETTALGAQAWLALAPEDPLARSALRWLAGAREGTRWPGSRATALALLALAAVPPDEPEAFSYGIWVNGVEVQTGRVEEADAARSQGVDLMGPQVPEGGVEVEIRRTGGGTSWWTASLAFRGREEAIPAAGQGLALQRRAFRLGPGGKRAPLKEGAVLHPGDTVEVVLDLDLPRPLAWLVVEDPRPAGLELLDPGAGPPGVHVEEGYDGVSFHVARRPAGRLTLAHRLRARFPGEFHAMPARARAAYAPEIHAHSAEWRVQVAP